jgi:hypothetical protein
MIKRFYFPLLVLAVLNLVSCQTGEKKPGEQSSKEKETAIQLKVNRFEMDLFSIPYDSVQQNLPALKAKYGAFLDLFSKKIIRIGDVNGPEYPKYLKSFITDKYMYLTYKKVKEVYPDFDAYTGEIEKGFEKYTELFPRKTIPHLYTLISGYNQSIVTADTMLGISLDKYLGENCEYYSNLQLPLYQRKVMTPAFVASDALKGWCYSEFVFNDSAENVLNNILYEGKMVYLMKELFPEKPDTIILGYTSEQLKWCKSNIEPMWTFMMENKLIFSTDYMTMNKLINPAPFTSYFTKESPGRAVIWIGYQIIKSYMENNKVSVPQLMADRNYQQILEKSKFEPK